MPIIKIQQWQTPLQLHKDTILAAALRQGVPYPHSCRVGECGHCKTRLFCGEVEHTPYLKDALSDAERNQGYILACCAKPKTNIEVAWLEPFESKLNLPPRRLQTKVIGLERATHNIYKLHLEVQGEAFAFSAGQYARLSIGKLPARSFSMANQPDDAMLEFHIRHLPDGIVSSYVAHQLKLDDTIRLQGPYGVSYLRNHAGPIIAVAGSTGLAPILSIIRSALVNLPSYPIHVYFGVQDEIDVYAELELQQLALLNPQLHSNIVLSAPSKPTSRRTGFIHHALQQDFSDLSDAKIYTAGPPAMVQAITAVALAHGANSANIHSDPFTISATANAQAGLLQGTIGVDSGQ